MDAHQADPAGDPGGSTICSCNAVAVQTAASNAVYPPGMLQVWCRLEPAPPPPPLLPDVVAFAAIVVVLC